MQQWLGVAAGLRHALEHQLSRRLVGRALEVTHHGGVELVTGVLLVHLGGHTLESFFHLRIGRDTVVQPAHHVAQNALGVVVQFGLLVGIGPIRSGSHGDLQQVVEDAWAGLLVVGFFQFLLYVADQQLVVVQGVQGGTGSTRSNLFVSFNGILN